FAQSDLQREQDQRILIKGILSKMTSPGTLANPFAVIPAANGAAAAITIDQGTGLTQLISVAFALRNPVTTTVPIANAGLSTSAGSAVEWNHTAARQFFSDLGHDRALPKDIITGAAVQGTAWGDQHSRRVYAGRDAGYKYPLSRFISVHAFMRMNLHGPAQYLPCLVRSLRYGPVTGHRPQPEVRWMIG